MDAHFSYATERKYAIWPPYDFRKGHFGMVTHGNLGFSQAVFWPAMAKYEGAGGQTDEEEVTGERGQLTNCWLCLGWYLAWGRAALGSVTVCSSRTFVGGAIRLTWWAPQWQRLLALALTAFAFSERSACEIGFMHVCVTFISMNRTRIVKVCSKTASKSRRGRTQNSVQNMQNLICTCVHSIWHIDSKTNLSHF